MRCGRDSTKAATFQLQFDCHPGQYGQQGQHGQHGQNDQNDSGVAGLVPEQAKQRATDEAACWTWRRFLMMKILMLMLMMMVLISMLILLMMIMRKWRL